MNDEFYYGEAVRYALKQVAFYRAKERMETISKNFDAKSNERKKTWMITTML